GRAPLGARPRPGGAVVPGLVLPVRDARRERDEEHRRAGRARAARAASGHRSAAPSSGARARRDRAIAARLPHHGISMAAMRPARALEVIQSTRSKPKRKTPWDAIATE